MSLFKIFRCDPEQNVPARYQGYRMETEEGETVLSALVRLREEQDPSLAFRASCRSGICGSDACRINGRAGLPCKAQVSEHLQDGVVVLEPLRGFPVIRDLVVDQTRFWEKLRQVKPWLIPGDPDPEKERLMRLVQEDFDGLSHASDCIFCAACYAECPMAGDDKPYLGPAALLKAYRFAVDPRDAGGEERRAALEGPGGLWRCHLAFRCTEVCPKEISPAAAIGHLKNEAARRHLGLGAKGPRELRANGTLEAVAEGAGKDGD